MPRPLKSWSAGEEVDADDLNGNFDEIWDTDNFKNGIATRAGDTASGDQTIAHGLGVTPRKVKITAIYLSGGGSTDSVSQSIGVYNGTTTSMVRWTIDPSDSVPTGASSSSNIVEVYAEQAASSGQTATIAVDDTNITLSWTKVGSPPNPNIILLWEVEA